MNLPNPEPPRNYIGHVAAMARVQQIDRLGPIQRTVLRALVWAMPHPISQARLLRVLASGPDPVDGVDVWRAVRSFERRGLVRVVPTYRGRQRLANRYDLLFATDDWQGT